ARILVRIPPHHVVEQPFAHGAIRDPHLLETEAREYLRQDGDAAREDRAPILRQGCELELPDVSRLDEVGDGALQARRGDQLGGLAIELADDLADRPHRTGAAGRALPAAAAEGRLHRFQLQARGEARAGHALGGDLAVAEEALAQADTAHLQALQIER